MEPTDTRFPASAPPPEPADAPSASPSQRLDFFSELKRRKVYRVGAAYLAVVFGALQGADLVFPALGLGPGAFNGLVLASLLGFPLVLALAWMFDITEGGIRRTAPVEAGDTVPWDQDRWARLKAGLVGAGFVVVVWVGARLWQAPAQLEHGAVPTESPVLAILPFTDLSPEGDQGYFADGLHEELLHQLASLRGLRLTSRTSALHFRGSPSRIGAIADSLGARYVMEGSVRRAADSVRLTVQLIDAETDEHIWSESFSRGLSMEGLFDLQRTLARRVAGSLGGTLVAGRAERTAEPPTRSLEAYNFFLRGLHHWHAFTRPEMEAAEDDFLGALAADPDFGRAHAMLALVYTVQNNLGMRVQGELFPTIKKHAELAFRHAPDDPETHFALSAVRYTIEWNWQEARKEVERALELDPYFTDARWALGEWHGIVSGSTDRALEIVADVLRQDPFSTGAEDLRGTVLHFGRRYAEAAEVYAALEAANPQMTTYGLNRVSNLALSGRVEEARAHLGEVLPRVPRPPSPTLAVHLARVGDLGGARAVRDEAMARRAAGAGVPASLLAAAEVAVGNLDGALSWLEVCFEEEGGIYTLRDPLWDPLRADPRFQALWDRVGLPGEPPPEAG